MYWGGVLFSLNNNVYAEEVSDFDNFKSNLENGTSVILEEDIDVTEPVVIKENSDVTIELNGHNLKCSPIASGVGGQDGAMIKATAPKIKITINNTSELEAGFINDGNENCRAIYTMAASGNLVVDNVKFDGFNVMALNGGGKGAAIYYKRQKASSYASADEKLEIKNSHFINNKSLNGGAVFLKSSFDAVDSILENNIFENNVAGATSWLNGYGGALQIGDESSRSAKFILKNNQIKNNETQHLKEIDNPGWIYYAGDGAGMFVYLASVDLIGNTLQNNIAKRDGGGFAFVTTDKVDLVLTDNTIDSNQAVRGGGIFFAQDISGVNKEYKVLKINSGTFTNNIATDDGGAINLTQGNYNYLQLKNALITGNQAVRGGGIWLCPTAKGRIHSTLSGAIYSNVATGYWINKDVRVLASGNDIRYSVESEEDALPNIHNIDTSDITVSPRSNDGHIVNWFKDEAIKRYQPGDSPVNIAEYQNRKDPFSLARVDGDTSQYDIIITGNKAGKRGGAIATNYTLEIGEQEDIDITVNKEFVKDGQPYNDSNKIADNLKIYINLYRIDENGERFLLDENVELNKDNNFTYMFTGLPAKYKDEDGNIKTYSYEVKEVDEKNQVSNTCTSLNREKTSCTITNEYVAPPVEFVPSVEKKVTGKTKPKKDASFTFEISSEEQDGVELPKNTKVTVNGEGRVNFGNIKITKAGEYNFTIKEVLGNNLDYKYDLSVWMVKVVVGENTENGTLYIDSIKYYKKNKEYEKVIFENEYNPSTGDPLLSNVSNFIISGFVILGISMIKRKIYN